jgi:hypothetical protein
MKLVHTIAFASALCIGLPALAQSAGEQSGKTTLAAASDSPSASDSSKKRGLRGKKGQTRKQMFDQLDTNRDGMISMSEAQANPDLVVIFVETDANADGSLSPAEFVVVPITLDDGTTLK